MIVINMTNELQHKPIVGDDGELLEADTSFPRIVYVEAPPPPLPTGIRAAKWMFYVILMVIVVTFLIGIFFVQSSSYVKPQQYVSVAPTEFADHAVYLQAQFRLPLAQSATEWATGLANIHGLNWSPDGTQLAIEYGQNQVASLDIATGEYAFKGVSAIAFDWSPTDSRQFVAADSRQIGIYSNVTLQTTLKPSAKFTMPPTLVRWSTDGTQIAALSQDRKLVNILYVSDGELATERPFEAPVWDMQWSPIMVSLLAIKDSGLIYLQPANKLIPQKEGLGVVYPDSSINWKRVSYAPDGLKMALVGLDCDLKVTQFNRPESSLIWIKRMADYTIQGCNADEAEITWSPKTEQIATFIHGDDTVYLWEGKAGWIVDRLIPLRSRPVTAIAWSPDGQYLAISSGLNITIWSPN